MAVIKIDIKTNLHGATIKIKGLDNALDGMDKQAKKGSSALKGMWKQMAAGIGVTAGVTVAVRAMINQVKDTIRKGREFEREWANVTTMLSISKEATGKMRDELLRLSPTLGDTTDLAAGMYQVLSASIEPAKAIKFLGEAAKSAKAGVTETKVAVDALTTVINAYGLAAEDVTDISDIMFGVVKRGKLTYDEMATSLGTIVPIAAQLGVGFKEIGAAMATMTRKGIDAQTATMQLRQVLMAVLSASDKVKKKAEDLDFEFTALALRTKGLSKFLADLKEATKGNNEVLREFLPNVRAVSGVMALGGEGARGLADDLEFLQEVMGLTNEAFEKQMDSMDFWIETADIAIDKFKTSFYGGFVTPLKDGITTSDELDETTNELMDTFKELGTFIGTTFKTAFDSLIRNYETTKRVIALNKILTEGFTLAIKSRQIPTLRNVIKLWAEHHAELEKNRKKVLEYLEEWKTFFGFDETITIVARNIINDIRNINEEFEGFATSFEDVWARVKAVEFKIFLKEYHKILEETEMIEGSFESMGNTVETTALQIAENIGFVVSEMDIFMEQIQNMSEAQRKWTELTLSDILVMQAGIKGFVNAILGTFEQWAIAQVIPMTMKLPFPASLVAMAVAIAAIKTAFAGLKGLAEGGMVGLHGPEIIKVGEKGPERVLSNKEIRSADSQSISTITYNVTLNNYIYPKELNRETIRRSGSWLWAEMDRQIKRGQQSG